MSVKSDIEIAQEHIPQRITEVAAAAGIDEKYLELYGNYKAKIDYKLLNETTAPDGKLILVTAITPTPAGEGKTTTSVGLADGLRKIGKDAVVALREPSLGPVFGVKGGAAGGGYATAVDAAKDTIRFDVASVNLHWSIKWGTTTLAIVDDTMGTTTIAANTISGDGTGYLSTMSGTNTYHDYSTPWSVSSVTAPVVITEGYIMTVNTVTAVGIGTWTVDMSNIVTCTAST